MNRGLYPAPDEEPPVSVSQTAASLPRADAPEPELKRCPHCGGAVALRVGDSLSLILECEQCPWNVVSEYGSEVEVRAAWNRRDGEDARIAEAVRVALHSQLHDVFEVLRWVERHGGRVERSGLYLRGENDGDRFSSSGIGDDTFERAVIWIHEQQAKERPE